MSKYVKTVDIARSGIYTYGKDEVAALRAGPIPAQYADRLYFNIYRPAHVIADAAHLFTRLPVVVEHPNSNVGPFNAQGLMSGFSGDKSDVAYHDGEVYIRSSLTLVADDAQTYYDHGYKEVSPGYNATSLWLDTEQEYNGVKYQLIMKEITGVNHLALTVKARGGETTRIIDSKGGPMKWESGLIRWAKKLLTKDSKSVRELLDSVTADNVETIVDAVVTMTEDLPEGEGKDKLSRFLTDLRHAKVLDSAQLKAAASKTADLFDSLDAESMKEVSEVPEEKKKEDGITDYNPGTTAAAGAGTSTVKPENANPETPALGDGEKEEEKKEPGVIDSALIAAFTDSVKGFTASVDKLVAAMTPPAPVTDSAPAAPVTDSAPAAPAASVGEPTMTLDSGSSGKGIDAFMAETFGKK